MSELLQAALNQAHHQLFHNVPTAWVVGHDIADPFGGAFAITRGLSAQFPDRVCSVSVSEASLVGIGTGLSLGGQRPIVEVDALSKGADVLINFAASPVFAPQDGMHLLVRCPFGGAGFPHREKYLIGFPRIDVYELTPFHDLTALLTTLTSLGHPAVLYEDRALYALPGFRDGKVDDLFEFTLTRPEGFARIVSPYFLSADCVIISAGGTSMHCVGAARRLYEEHEIECQVLVPARLHPFDLDDVREIVAGARFVLVVEDEVMGGGWGDRVASVVTPLVWGKALGPVMRMAVAYADLDVKSRAANCVEEIVATVVGELSMRVSK